MLERISTLFYNIYRTSLELKKVAQVTTINNIATKYYKEWKICMALINCPECNHRISDKSASCPNCGLPSSKMMLLINCPDCSEPVSNQSPRCSNCGCPIAKPEPFTSPHPLPTQTHTTIVQMSSPRRSKGVAIILALFLGGKFYLNQSFSGILYLLFCWTFIPAIIALIEVIMLLAMDEATFNEKFG